MGLDVPGKVSQRNRGLLQVEERSRGSAKDCHEVPRWLRLEFGSRRGIPEVLKREATNYSEVGKSGGSMKMVFERKRGGSNLLSIEFCVGMAGRVSKKATSCFEECRDRATECAVLED